jgi:hypothetical protein
MWWTSFDRPGKIGMKLSLLFKSIQNPQPLVRYVQTPSLLSMTSHLSLHQSSFSFISLQHIDPPLR